MLKMLVAVGVVWLLMGAVGGLLEDRQRPMTVREVALGPITLGREMLSNTIAPVDSGSSGFARLAPGSPPIFVSLVEWADRVISE